jgi:glycosyltransferase involved in cell wall biosynthesis
MKKILYLITQSELGGAQRYVFDLALNLKDEYEITVACGEPGEAGQLAEQLKEKGISYFIIPHLKRAISPISDFIALLEIIKLIKNLKPDFIHLNSSKISILGSIAYLPLLYKERAGGEVESANHKSKIIYTVHGWVFNEPLPAWQKKFYLHAEKITARFKDELICVSEYDRQIALQNKIAPADKLITIHNGISLIDFYDKEEARQKFSVMLARLAITPEKRAVFRDSIASLTRSSRMTIGSIGNLYKTKGLEYLIRAGKILKEKNIDFKIVIIGEGPEKANLANLINNLGLSDNIILAGRINDAARLLPAFDVYICPSVKEGLSYTIIEAMQAGLPIVATKVGGNPELITDGQEGPLVEARDPEAIAAAVIKLMDDPILTEQLTTAAKTKALARFTLAKMVADTKKIYS